jgi:CO/xanthine dehydrogenase FAD-binding subunit
VEFVRATSWSDALSIKAEAPAALPIAGGTDVMVEINFDRRRPAALLDLNPITELREWERDQGHVVIGAAVPYTRLIDELGTDLPGLAVASRTVGSPQIRNRGTIGGNLGTASPAGDALPPLLVEGAEVEVAKVGATRTLALAEFLVGPKRNALGKEELIVAVRVTPSKSRQTFMKVGPRNAMVIAVCSLALAVDREAGEIRAAYGSAGPVAALVTAPLAERDGFPERVAAAASPIDDVRGTAAYRRHALKVLTGRALERVLT